MLNAFLSILKARPELNLIFVGPDRGLTGSDGNLIQFGAYCDLLFPVKLRSRVDYLGPIANRDIEKLRVKAMLTVVASRWENMGYTVLEAMFQGCPLVSTDAGGCPEAVIDGATGRLAKSEDADDFAAQFNAMLNDPAAAQEMGRAARLHIIEHYSADKVAAATVEMYQRAISNCHG